MSGWEFWIWSCERLTHPIIFIAASERLAVDDGRESQETSKGNSEDKKGEVVMLYKAFLSYSAIAGLLEPV